MKLLLLSAALICCLGLGLAARLPSDSPLRMGSAAAAAAGGNPAPWLVCEAFNATECHEQQDCELCTRIDGLQLCFDPDIAAKLPVSGGMRCMLLPAASPPPPPRATAAHAGPSACPADLHLLVQGLCRRRLCAGRPARGPRAHARAQGPLLLAPVPGAV